MRPGLHLSWILLTLLLALAFGALYYLGWTEGGLQVVAGRLNGRWGPVTIQISGARGTLAGGAHLDRLVIDHRRVHIEIENASGRLAILPLAWQTIHARNVRTERLSIHVLPPVDTNDGPWEAKFLPTLLKIVADGVIADRGRLILPSGHALNATALRANGVLWSKTIRVYSGALDYNGVHILTDGEVLAASPIGLRGSLHFSAQPQGQPPWTAEARIDGDLAQLGITGNFSEPFTAVFRGTASDLTGAWRWQGDAALRRLDLTAWGASGVLGFIAGELQIGADRDGFQARGALTAPGLKAGPLDVDFSGSYADRVLSIAHLRLHHAASNASASATGTVGIVAGGPRLDLRGNWQDFRWPLGQSAAPVHSGAGHYHLEGLRPFGFSATGELQAGAVPPLQIDAVGKLERDRVSVAHALVEGFGAHAQLGGELLWSRIWNLRGRVDGLEVARLRPGVTGQLNFAVAASGAGFDADSPVDAQLSDLSGALRGQPASGAAHIARNNGELSFDNVRLQLGATRIDADGRFGRDLDLRFALQAQDLALLQPGAHGKLNARGTLRGSLHDPTVIVTASGRDIVWDGVRAGVLNAAIDFEPHDSGRADAMLRLERLQIADREISELSLSSAGTGAEHRLALTLNAPGINVETHATGHYHDGTWDAKIGAFSARDNQNLRLSLEAPAKLAVTPGDLSLTQLCLRDERARLCAMASRLAGRSTLALSATNLPLAMLTAGLTPSTDYVGTLNIEAEGADSGVGPWRGQLRAQLTDAALRRHFQSGRTETLNLGTGRVEVGMNESALVANLKLNAGSAGRIDANISARGLNATTWREWPLQGALDLESDALGFINSYISEIDRASGRVNASLAVGGTVGAPQVRGELKLAGAEFDLYLINLSLRAVNFSAKLADDSLTFQGSATAGPEGHAAIDGRLTWRGGLPYGDLHLQGHDLRVVNIPEARVEASPDVRLKMDGHRIEIGGQVTLPYARIESASLANAVLASSDERIVDDRPPAPADQFKISSDITLTLGDRVTVDTLGLSGRLSGSIRVTSDDSGISRGSGELNIEEGKYTAYGRKLDVERGRLLFSNGLLSDPAVDLRATKTFPDITAGVNVRGTLREPRMTFFSMPEVAQSQIVSLLLAGGSLESVQNAAGTSGNANAARSGLMQGGAIVAQQLGGKIGIADVGVESDLTNDTSLVLGRYLSPRLYISYGIGLAETLNTIKLRYTVGDHWTVKTEAGTQRSADLVFTIEK
jgi:translocation and assembly module TamB